MRVITGADPTPDGRTPRLLCKLCAKSLQGLTTAGGVHTCASAEQRRRAATAAVQQGCACTSYDASCPAMRFRCSALQRDKLTLVIQYEKADTHTCYSSALQPLTILQGKPLTASDGVDGHTFWEGGVYAASARLSS
jgi:hypothetical protein